MSTTDKPKRLFEYKVLYTRPGWMSPGEHYYMCLTAEEAVTNHSVISETHGRGLIILSVQKKNPFSNLWEDETSQVQQQIDDHNKHG